MEKEFSELLYLDYCAMDSVSFLFLLLGGGGIFLFSASILEADPQVNEILCVQPFPCTYMNTCTCAVFCAVQAAAP